VAVQPCSNSTLFFFVRLGELPSAAQMLLHNSITWFQFSGWVWTLIKICALESCFCLDHFCRCRLFQVLVNVLLDHAQDCDNTSFLSFLGKGFPRLSVAVVALCQLQSGKIVSLFSGQASSLSLCRKSRELRSPEPPAHWLPHHQPWLSSTPCSHPHELCQFVDLLLHLRLHHLCFLLCIILLYFLGQSMKMGTIRNAGPQQVADRR